MRAVRLLSFLLFVLAVPLAPAAAQGGNDTVAATLEMMIDQGEVASGSDADDQQIFEVYGFYSDRLFKPIWVRDDGPKTKGWSMLSVLRFAGDDGLEPSDYHVAELEKLIESADPVGLAHFEILMTRAFLDYASDLASGRTIPKEVDSELDISPAPPPAKTILEGAEAAEDIAPYVETLAPSTYEYARLKKTLADYRKIEREGGFPIVPDDEVLKPGMDQPRVEELRRFLVAAGDVEAARAGGGTVYDDGLVEAVKHFQERHGLEIDGVIGPSTLAEINTPVSARIATILLNMERRRWMNDDLGRRYVFVNLADQFLKVVENDKTIHAARLVVGKPFHRTPVFSDLMEYAVINPEWNVPPSIGRNELLPQLRKNPGALAAQNIRVLANGVEVNPYAVDWNAIAPGNLRYSFRQDSGTRNALGVIKFMFPNKYNVYIHDTPSKGLFARATRTFSHGCMRVQYPLDLGAVLLGPAGWDKAKIEQVVRSGRKTVVRLAEPIPVHVTYLTAWTNKDGTVNFRKDVYDRDARLEKALEKSRLTRS
ncbi:MAG: murein L,D-transpeptidase [Flavobacteriaceae bacterium]